MQTIFAIAGMIIGGATVIGCACFAIGFMFEAYSRHKTHAAAYRSMVEFREVEKYCSYKRPIITEILSHCEFRGMSTSEFRELLNKKYPIQP